MPPRSGAGELVPADLARRLLLDSAGLLASPEGRCGPRTIERTIRTLGFVQVDAIAVSARAHEHILMSRHDAFRADTLRQVVERDRAVFEHWTHDASLIRIDWYAAWHRRFRRARGRGVAPNEWWRERIGPRAGHVVRRVLDDLAEHGPAPASAIAKEGRAARGGWWQWTPEKTALEYAWRAGLVAIAGRRDFTKLYDLAERVHPEGHAADMPTPAGHRDWAMRVALERLVVASPPELARFLEAVDLPAARAWCERALRRGEVVPVRIEGVDGRPPLAGVARPDWRRHAESRPDAPARARPLSPFDPAIRERPRAARVLGLDYRFEAFVPAAKRRHGYYVLPILDGDRFVARADVKLDRTAGHLRLPGFWWEPGLRPSKPLRARVREGLERYARQCGAASVDPLPV